MYKRPRHASDRYKHPDGVGWAALLESGLYPILLEYPDDSFEPAGGGYGAEADAASYLRSRWTDDSWPPFPEWPGLARPAVTSADVDACAGEVASAVARDGRARCLAGRPADVRQAQVVVLVGLTRRVELEVLPG
ncbi:hypothetical protein [Streptomyces antibioticus]|uniref:hypothetical protein n=1 Tax=Streptomyces antibioticus TaxID=1890 RepID=UPI0036B697BD